MSAPHFAVPLTITAAGAATVSQDSAREIAQCVAAILRTHPGSRASFPDMGVADPAFDGLDADEVLAQAGEYEPRAELLADTTIEALTQEMSIALR